MSTAIFIGLQLMAPIRNQKRYDAVFNEILQYLQMNQEELTIRIDPGKHVTFQAVSSSPEIGCSFDQVLMPISCQYFTTRYFRLHSGIQVSQEEKRFASIAWEVLNILKENFPSKILLYQDNLEQCKPVFLPLSSSEELRRQISCLMTLKEENRALTLDEIEDLWFTLSFADKLNDQRSIGVCLDILTAQVNLKIQGKIDLANFYLDEQLLTRIIAKADSSATALQSNKSQALDIINNYQNSLKMQDEGIQLNSLQSSESSQVLETGATLTQQYQALIPKVDKPTSTRMCLFQLSESNDINRVTLILRTLSSKSRDSIIQMRQKYNLSTKLISILRKYCNADFGFDHLASKNGSFQYYLTKMMILLASDYAVFLEYLQTQTLDWLCQMIEEAVIFANDHAIQQANGTNESSDYIDRFLRLSLDFMDLAVSKNFAEFIPLVRDNLIKVQTRFIKVVQKREQNPLIQYFINQQNGQEPSQQSNSDVKKLNFDQLIQIKGVSEGLYQFATELNIKLQRVEGLNDTLFENHEDKYSRLFPLLAARTLANQGKIQQTQSDISLIDQQNPVFSQQKQPRQYIPQRAVQFTEQHEPSQNVLILQQNQLPTRQAQQYESLPTFSGCYEEEDDTYQLQDTFERQMSNRENQENLSTNVYLKNKIEHGFKRLTVNQQQSNSHQQLKPRSTKDTNSELMIIAQQKSRDSIQTMPNKIDTISSNSKFNKYL